MDRVDLNNPTNSWVCTRRLNLSAWGGATCTLFPSPGPNKIIRWSVGAATSGDVYFDCEGDWPDDTEPYMGYTPGEDDRPERGAWPGERYMA